MLKKLKEKQGYISLETVIIAGLMIGFGAYAMTEFFSIAQIMLHHSMNLIDDVLEIVF